MLQKGLFLKNRCSTSAQQALQKSLFLKEQILQKSIYLKEQLLNKSYQKSLFLNEQLLNKSYQKCLSFNENYHEIFWLVKTNVLRDTVQVLDNLVILI